MAESVLKKDKKRYGKGHVYGGGVQFGKNIIERLKRQKV